MAKDTKKSQAERAAAGKNKKANNKKKDTNVKDKNQDRVQIPVRVITSITFVCCFILLFFHPCDQQVMVRCGRTPYRNRHYRNLKNDLRG